MEDYKLLDGLNDLTLSLFFGTIGYTSVVTMIALGVGVIPLICAVSGVYFFATRGWNVTSQTWKILSEKRAARKETRGQDSPPTSSPAIDERKTASGVVN